MDSTLRLRLSGETLMLQSLALTGLGGLLAIVGTLLGHRWQAVEARHSRLENYQREDRYRLHQERRAAYADFHLAVGHARSTTWLGSRSLILGRVLAVELRFRRVNGENLRTKRPRF
ncbi:hypothetical protein AB0C84_25235 [Actinomadura sp. NPDC048955]|uniref:hypothetical protein n=1 Tax=Actinomadura sp. NPDC048955 TaxID=3158228 RepID=UPI0033FC368A